MQHELIQSDSSPETLGKLVTRLAPLLVDYYAAAGREATAGFDMQSLSRLWLDKAMYIVFLVDAGEDIGFMFAHTSYDLFARLKYLHWDAVYKKEQYRGTTEFLAIGHTVYTEINHDNSFDAMVAEVSPEAVSFYETNGAKVTSITMTYGVD